MKSASLLCLSVCLNLALAGAANHYWFKKPAVRSSTAATNMVPVTVQAQPNRSTNPSAPVSCIANRFHWRQLESTNYEEFVANLRAVGCPEKTIRDIILADVGKLYAARRRELDYKRAFWLAGNQRRKARQAQEAELEALRHEQEALIRRLLGIEWFADSGRMCDSFEEQALARFFFGPMPEETFQRAVHLFEKYDALKGELDRRCDGIRLEEDDAQLRNLGQRMQQELASILAPAQLEELMARAVGAGFDHAIKLEGVDVTATELRQLALAKATAEGKIFDWPADETDDERRAKEEQFQTATRNLLGDERFADFERAQDGDFRTVFSVTKDNGLPKEIAVKVFEIRKLTGEEVQRLRNDTSLDEPARQRRLDELQATVQPAVLGALGPKAYQDYLQHDGGWVTNANGL